MKIVIFYNPAIDHPQYGLLDNIQAWEGGKLLRDEYYEYASVTRNEVERFIEEVRKDFPGAEIEDTTL